jgi:hypothetical protein
MQWRARMKLLQRHEFCELRRPNLRDCGPCDSKKASAAEHAFHLSLKKTFTEQMWPNAMARKNEVAAILLY